MDRIPGWNADPTTFHSYNKGLNRRTYFLLITSFWLIENVPSSGPWLYIFMQRFWTLGEPTSLSRVSFWCSRKLCPISCLIYRWELIGSVCRVPSVPPASSPAFEIVLLPFWMDSLLLNKTSFRFRVGERVCRKQTQLSCSHTSVCIWAPRSPSAT